MSFSADWLGLRADADDRARNASQTAALAQTLSGRPSVRVLDLGSGTGANLQALAPHLPGGQHWVLADNDPALLERITAPGGVSIETRETDLSADPARLFLPCPDLVTASAFFDLCGGSVINAIVQRTVACRAIFHTVLTYDGRENWAPPHPADAAVLAAFYADQRRDKGLGPALGPNAADHLSALFGAEGYRVSVERSDWELEQPRDAELIRALASGSAAAVRPVLGERADQWLEARLASQRVMIGHLDLLALPPE